RPGADERHARARVVAVDSDLARRAAPDLLLLAAAPRDGNGLRFLSQQLHPIRLDQDVDHERAPGLLLAVEAVTAVHEERLRRHAEAAGAPEATAGHVRRPSSTI